MRQSLKNCAILFFCSVASLYGGKIEIYTDKMDGPILATVNVNTSGEGDIWKKVNSTVKNINGIHDLYFVFREENDLFNSTGGDLTSIEGV